jgi:DNA-binding LacI/PurR family transcriptional regulator
VDGPLNRCIMVSVRTDDPSHPRVRALRQVRQWLDQGQLGLGDPVPSELVLAKQLGIGRSAVRWAMRNLEDEGLIGIEGKGRVVRRGNLNQPSAASSLMANAVVILGAAAHPGVYQVSTGWDCYVGISAEQAIRAAGQHVIMVSPQALDEGGMQRLVVERPRGVLAMLDAGGNQALNATVEALHRAGVPVVGYLASQRSLPVAGIDVVVADHAAGGAALVRFLAARGCRRILRLWSYPAHRPVPDWLADREAGAMAALAEVGGKCLPPCFAPCPQGLDGSDEGFEISVTLMTGALAKQLRTLTPDAVMVTNDGVASQAIAALQILGLDPEAIPVVGYDGIWRDLPFRTAESLAPAASVDRDCLGVGAAMATMLQARLGPGRRAPPHRQVITPRLIRYDREGNPPRTESGGWVETQKNPKTT